MANKTQAKAAIDSAVIDIKNDIDNILPIGVNINDGSVSFNPTRYVIQLDAGNNSATALSWFNSIKANLISAARPNFIEFRSDRRNDDIGKKNMGVRETKLTVMIINF